MKEHITWATVGTPSERENEIRRANTNGLGASSDAVAYMLAVIDALRLRSSNLLEMLEKANEPTQAMTEDTAKIEATTMLEELLDDAAGNLCCSSFDVRKFVDKIVDIARGNL